MLDFNAKMHQNRFRLGLRPRPRWAAGGAYSAPPDPLAAIGFKGPTSKGRGGDVKGEKGREREGIRGGLARERRSATSHFTI